MTMTDLPHTERWLADIGGADPDAAGRISEILIDGLNATGGPETAGLRLLVLSKMMGAMVASLRHSGLPEGQRIAQAVLANLAGAVEAEARECERAFERDSRPQRAKRGRR